MDLWWLFENEWEELENVVYTAKTFATTINRFVESVFDGVVRYGFGYGFYELGLGSIMEDPLLGVWKILRWDGSCCQIECLLSNYYYRKRVY